MGNSGDWFPSPFFFVMSKNAFREEVWGQNAPKNEVNSVNCDKKAK